MYSLDKIVFETNKVKLNNSLLKISMFLTTSTPAFNTQVQKWFHKAECCPSWKSSVVSAGEGIWMMPLHQLLRLLMSKQSFWKREKPCKSVWPKCRHPVSLWILHQSSVPRMVLAHKRHLVHCSFPNDVLWVWLALNNCAKYEFRLAKSNKAKDWHLLLLRTSSRGGRRFFYLDTELLITLFSTVILLIGKLPGSSDPVPYCSEQLGLSGIHHCTWPSWQL